MADDPNTNESPDTDGDEPVVDVEELANTITERVRASLATDGGGAGGGDSESSGAAADAGHTEPSTSPAAPAPADISGQIEAGVRRVLGEAEHAAQHAAIAPAERPPRKGVARLLWGA